MQKVSRWGGAGHCWMAVCVLAIGGVLVGCQNSKWPRERAEAAYSRGDMDKARTDVQKAIEIRSTDGKAQYLLGKIELDAGEPLRAQLAFEKARELSTLDKELMPDILDGIAQALLEQGRVEQLGAFLEDAATRYGTSRDYLRQAKYLRLAGDLDGAKLAYRKATYFAKPGDATPYLAAADFHESINDYATALLYVQYAYYVNDQEASIPARLRKFGKVPGPTQKIKPPKPEAP